VPRCHMAPWNGMGSQSLVAVVWFAGGELNCSSVYISPFPGSAVRIFWVGFLRWVMVASVSNWSHLFGIVTIFRKNATSEAAFSLLSFVVFFFALLFVFFFPERLFR